VSAIAQRVERPVGANERRHPAFPSEQGLQRLAALHEPAEEQRVSMRAREVCSEEIQ
jgi:hypothetical protein